MDSNLISEEAVRGTNPAAEVFQPLDEHKFGALVEDIKRHGLREAITLDGDGCVVDGVNRLKACHAAGVTPRFTRWDGQGSALESGSAHANVGDSALIVPVTCAHKPLRRRALQRDLPPTFRLPLGH
jgi:hypothetical protein